MAPLSAWDAEDCFWELPPEQVQQVNDPAFVELKDKMREAVKGSWCSEEKLNLLMDTVLIQKPSVCVEVGAFMGSSVLPVAATLQYLHHGRVFAVDGWSNDLAVRYLDKEDPNRPWWGSLPMDSIEAHFYHLINHYGVTDQVAVIKADSVEAANLFEQIDFLHLDGDYSATGSSADVDAYLPHVRSGGLVLLSNVYVMVNGKQPKLKAVQRLMKYCDILSSIERDHAILFVKR